ncbi:unnamed protein product [Lasius platythorax]|uniref:Endonuclease/exonuclease/phosphatase domain-containing protein n=1 Tax=Lasius platythorax TaxID=488582 RepID=A0AAV2NN32_9HYME
MDIKILLWNARGWNNKKEELYKRVQEYDISVITETKSREYDLFRVPGYNKIEKQRDDQNGGGVAMFIKKSIQVKVLEETRNILDNMEILGVKCRGLSKKINIIGIYRRPGRVERRGMWKEIINMYKIKPEESTIMLGDFNAHSQVWNCGDTDSNGNNLLEEAEDMHMVIVNRDTLSRIEEGGVRPSNLDLMFTTNDIFDLLTYKQEKDSWGSDHYPIIFEMKIGRKIYKKQTNKITKKKTDWKEYEKIIRQ